MVERPQCPLVRGISTHSSFSRSKSPISLLSARQHPRPKQKVGQPTILPPLLVVPVALHRYDERRIHDPRAERIEEVEDKDAGGQGWILERPDRARGRFRFLDGRIGPFEHLLVSDRASRSGETHERLGDVQPAKSTPLSTTTTERG